MGVILDYAEARIEEVKNEVQNFLKRPLDYIMDKQVLRKAILLEFLDHMRPVRGTEWEHRIERWRKGVTV